MSQKQTHSPNGALRRVLGTLALMIGVALPVMIALFLVATSGDGENPLERIPEYEDPMQETVIVPFGLDDVVRTEFKYQREVRVIVEGFGQADDAAVRDLFYTFADAGGTPLDEPQAAPPILEINGERVLSALDLGADPPPFAADHTYTGILTAGSGLRTLSFRVTDAASSSAATGQFTITVIQIE